MNKYNGQRGKHTRRGGYAPPPWPECTRERSEGPQTGSSARQRALGYRPPPRKPLLKRVRWGFLLAWTVYLTLYAGVAAYFVWN